MKNLVIYKNIFNKAKSYLIVGTLVSTIVLSGCSGKEIDDSYIEAYTGGQKANIFTSNSNNSCIEDYTSGQKTDIFTSNSNDSDIVESNLTCYEDIKSQEIVSMKDINDSTNMPTKIDFTDINYNDFKLYLESLKTIYDYESYYYTDYALNEYNKLNLATFNDGLKLSMSIENLKSIVKLNNEDYMDKTHIKLYEKLTEEELNKVCEIIISTANSYIKNYKISEERVKCVLNDLKVFKQDGSLNNAYVTDDNCLVISPNMLHIANMINGKDTEKDIILHETIHLLQKGCNCDLENNSNLKRNFGISYGFNNVKVNSLDFTWLYEASAEKNMMNLTGHEPLVYQSMIGYLESLSLVNLVDDNYNVHDTEELSFKRSLDDLYNYFGVASDSEKKEILNMMYSIEIMQQEPSDFYKILEEVTGRKKNDSLVDEVNYTVKASICETLTKLFYKNLSKNIANNDVTLEDVFYLISLFENDLNSHIKYKDNTKYSYNEEFINIYVNIQDNFFYELAKSMNCSQEEIENTFDNYTSYIRNNDGNVVKNCSLNFLSKEKIDYLNEREEALNLLATISIRNTLKEFSNKNLQKVYN